MKKITKITDFTYRIQAFLLRILEKLFLCMGIKFSSFFAGTLLMIFGPFTPPSFLAMRNIKKAMPELTFFNRLKIVIGMWNNLGRNLAEFVCFNDNNFKNLSDFINMDSKSLENLEKIKQDPHGELIVTAHFGNWEIFPRIFTNYNIKFSAIYREMNNQHANKIVVEYREKNGMELIPKGQKGVIKLARSLRSGRKILMLVDQRLKNGIVVPFFNIPSYTSDAVATFSLKHNYKVYVVVAFRRSFTCFFDIKIEEFEVINTGNLEEDIKNTTIKINKQIEEWVKTKPEQWFWVHNRWK